MGHMRCEWALEQTNVYYFHPFCCQANVNVFFQCLIVLEYVSVFHYVYFSSLFTSFTEHFVTYGCIFSHKADQIYLESVFFPKGFNGMNRENFEKHGNISDLQFLYTVFDLRSKTDTEYFRAKQLGFEVLCLGIAYDYLIS